MRILALDPANKCGWAVWDEHKVHGGTCVLTPKRDESKGMRLIRLNAFLNATYKKFGPELVAFEAARHQGIGGAAVSQAELQGVIKLFCESCQLPYIGYSPSTIKKHATGKGTASKDMMVAAATEKFGKVVDDNHADALWIMDYARKEFEK